ncbi:MerR family transcriptional regulator [Herbidospora sp. NBRC 101105]|uniref:MerR family transcriptional regulator n=1 Tax=Herbidospora sp. NBRC 101105 TaxID=3032195 RepID=UPI0024A428B6|nr:MerR family transcriptional regulator [Herbidospora sp. NBRC 101105]GLX99183.1 MerR family transcriptional regulator [Herbidospora sp. NBRC 101105]
MLIGELGRRTGVNAHQLRYYEAQGLLAPSRGPGGYREYTSDAVVTVTQIRRMLKAGLSTQEIAFLLPCATGELPEFRPCPEVLDMLRAKLTGMEEHIEALSATCTVLQDYITATERQPAYEP